MTRSTSQPAPAPRRSPEASGRPRREPIRTPWLWIAVAGALLLVVPWWAPAGTIDPVIAGLPAWFLGTFLGALFFSGVASWACLRRWNLVEDEETAADAKAEGSRR